MEPIKLFRIVALVSTLLFTLFAADRQVGATDIPSPQDQLKPTIDKMIQVLNDQSLKGDAKRAERRAKIMEIAHERFDFEEMSKRALGKEWRRRTPEERKKFVQLFTQLLEHAYIGKLEGYSGRNVTFLDQRIKGKRAVVQTTVTHNGKEIPVYYVMILKGDTWMVYDIIIEGVSLLRNYIEQFKSILRKEKYEGLVKQLKEKIKKLEESGGDSADQS